MWGSDSMAEKKLEIQGDAVCISCFRKYTTFLNFEIELLNGPLREQTAFRYKCH